MSILQQLRSPVFCFLQVSAQLCQSVERKATHYLNTGKKYKTNVCPNNHIINLSAWFIGLMEVFEKEWWWSWHKDSCRSSQGKRHPRQNLFLRLFSKDPFLLKREHSYIQKAEVLEVRTPQIILIFRKFIVWERKNYQICSVQFCQEEQ